MEGYRSFAATVIGGSHVKEGIVCQDASNFYNDEKVSIAVVADGHSDSSCFRSDKGSEFAVNCAKKGIQDFVKEHEALFKKGNPPSQIAFEKLLREKLIRQIVASWNRLVMESYQKKPFTEEELKNVKEKYRKRYEKGEQLNKAYGTSLIAAAITPWYWFGLHIGDGRFSVLYEDGSGAQPVPWDPKCYLNVTTSICDDDVLDREFGVRTFLYMKKDEKEKEEEEKTDKGFPVAIFVCSDGIDDNYPVDEKENAKQLYRLYRDIAITLVDDGYESTCGADGKSGQIKELANQFATKGKGDDTSLAGIVNIEELIRVAPAWKEKILKVQEQGKLEALCKTAEEGRHQAEAEAKAAQTSAKKAADQAAAAQKAKTQKEAEQAVEIAKELAEQAEVSAKRAAKEAEAAQKAAAQVEAAAQEADTAKTAAAAQSAEAAQTAAEKATAAAQTAAEQVSAAQAAVAAKVAAAQEQAAAKAAAAQEAETAKAAAARAEAAAKTAAQEAETAKEAAARAEKTQHSPDSEPAIQTDTRAKAEEALKKAIDNNPNSPKPEPGSKINIEG